MARRALVVGINHYKGESPFGSIPNLDNPVNDANEIAKLLERHHDGDANFGVKKILVDSDQSEFTTAQFYDQINWLYSGNFESVVFYFAGHGHREPQTGTDYLVSTDGTFPNYGVRFDYILNKANNVHPNIHNCTIVLDCCHAGGIGENAMFGQNVSLVGKGVTLLAGCQTEEFASDGEFDGNGVFTGMLLDGLGGHAGDIFGRVTPASLYNLVDQRLGPLDQRPVYKANVSQFAMLRRTPENIGREKLREVLGWFTKIDKRFKLGPEFERAVDRGHFTDDYAHIPTDPEKFEQFSDLKSCVRLGLIEPYCNGADEAIWHEKTEGSTFPPRKISEFSMWHAAMYKTGCRLTSSGQHYWKLNKSNYL